LQHQYAIVARDIDIFGFILGNFELTNFGGDSFDLLVARDFCESLDDPVPTQDGVSPKKTSWYRYVYT
jgi:hypothetical protein